MRPLALLAAALPLLAPFIADAADSTQPRVSFNRDIRPIMSDTCFHCHGFDASTRKAGMRLDIREEALKRTKGGFIPIVPGKPDESEIILRIQDADDPMPPAEAHKTLTKAQKDLFRRWVAEGAEYEPHWAYAKLTRPQVPTSRDPKYAASNPVDAFIRATLAEKKIAPSAEADPQRLIRRVTLDLTGLPPTPEDVSSFLTAHKRDPKAAYNALVERLLGSAHHGERMAVWWLDIARYSDTVGFHGDQNQRIFPYRDYVIDAFTKNKRFDAFTREQLAGDLLPSPTTEQLVATGYNRLNMMTREGGAQAKEYLAKYGAERVRSVAAAWFGSTFGCAECHDHKFDPIKTRDFYELQAFFADVKQWGVYSSYRYTPNPDLEGFNNDFPFPPEMQVASPYLAKRKQRFEADLAAQRVADAALAHDPAHKEAFAAWVADARTLLMRNPAGWQQPTVEAAHLGKGDKPVASTKLTVDEDRIVRLGRELKNGEALRLEVKPEAGWLASFRLEFLEAPGESAMKKSAVRNTLKLVAALRGIDGKERKVDLSFADATAKENRYQNGHDILGIMAGWRLPEKAEGPYSGTWLLDRPTRISQGDTLVLKLTGEAVPSLRVFTSPFSDPEPSTVVTPEVIAAVLASPAPLTPAQATTLAAAWLHGTRADAAAVERQQKIAASIREMRNGRAWTLVTEQMKPIDVRVLARGNWQDETGPIVGPATPSFLPARRESTEEKRLTRLDLANWIVSDDNPITARVVMNRLWAMYFGTGLSAVIDDLGSQGELPSHPELLDWLAAEFRSSGWDMRHMIRLIVTSATYRQSSSLRPELRDIDPANRLLASQNPRRLEAEFIRDAALFAAGMLNLNDIGGPSATPYQPAGYYAALQFPNRDYVNSSDDEQWRRGVYMHWQRTFLHPMLANFDAPARDECAAARTVSNTPQQALTLLNDPSFVEAARTLAARATRAAGDDSARLSRLFQFALGREPKPAEATSLKALLATQRDTYKAAPEDATKLLRVGISPPPADDPIELAAWTQAARVVLNSQEFITRY